eukprot:CAMPEP_0117759878 /NCGR_PEP_ID=MMETSP0947-20121206/16268_1 /TAXON_ID=44440 /ORGANISM="Chattonella subsalsa, Strain CCMP2191" /LENGTH=357 /DNA_ID=CAMNT_0005580405 /DNA_START=362 /DNA_END=1435 /DNA_ORIENTATION=-
MTSPDKIAKKEKNKQQDTSRYSNNRFNSADAAVFTETGRILDQVGGLLLLTSDEEILLGHKIQQLMRFEEVYKSLKESLGRAPSYDEWSLSLNLETHFFCQQLMECRQAKKQMVSHNMRLVVSIAKKYRHLGLNFPDLVQEGSMGLIKAAEKFDPSKGYKFSTYAAWWIQQSILKSVANHSRTIRLPTHVHNLLYKVRRLRRDSISGSGEDLSSEEVAARLSMPYKRLQKYLDASQSTVSTENPSGNGEAPSLVDINLSRSNIPEDYTELLLLRKTLLKVLEDLPHEQQLVMGLRYGIHDGIPRTAPKVAEQLDCRVEVVRRHESKAMEKLRTPQIRSKMQHFLESAKVSEQKTTVM